MPITDDAILKPVSVEWTFTKHHGDLQCVIRGLDDPSIGMTKQLDGVDAGDVDKVVGWIMSFHYSLADVFGARMTAKAADAIEADALRFAGYEYTH